MNFFQRVPVRFCSQCLNYKIDIGRQFILFGKAGCVGTTVRHNCLVGLQFALLIICYASMVSTFE